MKILHHSLFLGAANGTVDFSPMHRKWIIRSAYSPKIGLCTVIRIAWYWEETTEAGFKDADELE